MRQVQSRGRLRVTRYSFEDLVWRVKVCGVIRVSAKVLRNLVGKRRLGVRVAAIISARLAERGLTHRPLQFPQRQDGIVVVCKAGSAVAEALDA